MSEMRSTYPVYFPPRRAYADGVLLVGDAARVSEPVTGEGIYFALKSGVLLQGPWTKRFQMSDFSAARLRSYERDCRSAFRAASGNQCVYSLAYLSSRASFTCYSTLSEENTVVGSDRST